MIDRASLDVLLDLLRRESRSLLRYIGESFPWTTPDEQAALPQFQEIVKEEMAGAAKVARFLAGHRVSPPTPLGPYPMTFTNINYMSLDHLLPILQTYQRGRIEELSGDMKKLTDPQCRQQLEEYINLKRRDLALLESLAQPQPA